MCVFVCLCKIKGRLFQGYFGNMCACVGDIKVPDFLGSVLKFITMMVCVCVCCVCMCDVKGRLFEDSVLNSNTMMVCVFV